MCMRNLLCRRGTTLLCSAGNHVVGDRGSMFRTRMYKQSLSVGIRVQPMTITIEELQFQGRVESGLGLIGGCACWCSVVLSLMLRVERGRTTRIIITPSITMHA